MIILNARPEVAQRIDPVAWRAACDQCRVDRADRGADHPVRCNSGLMKCLVYPNLIGAERTPALEDEDGLAESGYFLGKRSGHGIAFHAALRAADLDWSA